MQVDAVWLFEIFHWNYFKFAEIGDRLKASFGSVKTVIFILGNSNSS